MVKHIKTQLPGPICPPTALPITPFMRPAAHLAGVCSGKGLTILSPPWCLPHAPGLWTEHAEHKGWHVSTEFFLWELWPSDIISPSQLGHSIPDVINSAGAHASQISPDL